MAPISLLPTPCHWFGFSLLLFAVVQFGSAQIWVNKTTDNSPDSEQQQVTPEPLGQKCNFSGPGHCPTGFICQNGECVRRCFFMGNCPSGFFCKGNFVCAKKECSKKDLSCCAHCPETCIKQEDCPTGWGCVFNKCRRVECRSKNDCEFGWPCVMGKCIPSVCMQDSECPQGWNCGPIHRCAKEPPNTTKKH